MTEHELIYYMGTATSVAIYAGCPIIVLIAALRSRQTPRGKLILWAAALISLGILASIVGLLLSAAITIALRTLPLLTLPFQLAILAGLYRLSMWVFKRAAHNSTTASIPE